MKISKKDALSWFEFFAQLPAGEQLLVNSRKLFMPHSHRLRQLL